MFKTIDLIFNKGRFKMNLEILKQTFSVCKIEDLSQLKLKDDFFFIGKTDEEFSLVCSSVPKNTIERSDDWKALRIRGTLDFSLTGILSRISSILAENKIPIFAISTYNTDYILTKSKDFKKAINILMNHGYTCTELN